MKQRLALARALVHDPQILFLDEPTAALDPEAARTVTTLIESLSRESGRTVFLATHNLDEAQRLCTPRRRCSVTASCWRWAQQRNWGISCGARSGSTSICAFPRHPN